MSATPAMVAIRRAAVHKAYTRWLCAGDPISDAALAAGRRYARVSRYCTKRTMRDLDFGDAG